MTTRICIASLSLSLAMLGGSGGANAADPEAPATARLKVDASPTCTTRAELTARVRARSPRVRFVDAGDAIEIRAEFSEKSATFVTATVFLASGDAKPSVRRVVGASCGDAADAVALIIAVTLDPAAAIGKKAAPANEAPSVGLDDVNAPTATSPKAPTSTMTSRSAAPPTLDAVRALHAGGRASVAVEVAGQTFLGPAPKLMPAIALFATVGIERRAPWSPAVLIGASHAWQSGIDEEGGTAAFTLNSASFDACPLRFRWGRVDARPCGSVLIGLLSARGERTLNRATSARLFWVVGGSAVATADLSDLLRLTARLAVGGNLVRDSFVFTPVVFHEVPAVTIAASLGIGAGWR